MLSLIIIFFSFFSVLIAYIFRFFPFLILFFSKTNIFYYDNAGPPYSSQLACYSAIGYGALHRYRRGQGFESRTSLIISGFLFANEKVASITAIIFFTFNDSKVSE